MDPRTILITGATRGIGHDAAYALARRGHRVFAATHFDRQVAPAQAASDAAGLRITWLKLDVTAPADVARARDIAPDVLINNAAVGESGPMSEVPLARLRLSLETNVVGPLALVQAVVPAMAGRGGGRIVSLSSVAGKLVIPGLGAYHVTKFGIEAMSDALRLELKRFGIPVAIVEPAKIATGFNERMLASKWEWLAETSLFRALFPAWRETDKAFVARQHPTTRVVQAIVHAVESPRPRIRYPAPFDARVITWASRFVPDRWKDASLSR